MILRAVPQNRFLELVHGLSDLGTFLVCTIAFLVAVYVYRDGALSHLKAYRWLWISLSALILSCGLSRLGSFLSLLPFAGGGDWIFWVVGLFKLAMFVSAVTFSWIFWRKRRELVMYASVYERALRQIDEAEARNGSIKIHHITPRGSDPS